MPTTDTMFLTPCFLGPTTSPPNFVTLVQDSEAAPHEEHRIGNPWRRYECAVLEDHVRFLIALSSYHEMQVVHKGCGCITHIFLLS